ncbi:MAG: hypothetical protein WC748_02570 [Legionellales bacterium]|jgi:hypothetical protein
MRNQEIINKRLLPRIKEFLSALKAEVMDPKWEGQGYKTVTRRPDGIDRLRDIFDPLSNPFDTEYDLLLAALKILKDKNYNFSITRNEMTMSFYEKQFEEGGRIFSLVTIYDRFSKTIFPNECDSTIECVEINNMQVTIFQKNAHEYKYREGQIPHMLRDQMRLIEQGKRMLSDTILDKIRSTFKPTLEYYENSKNTFSIFNQDDCLKLYAEILKLIIEHMRKSNKPFLIVIGEFHNSASDLLMELIVIQIGLQFGLKQLLLELKNTALKRFCEEKNPINYLTRANMSFLVNHFSPRNVQCIALEGAGFRDEWHGLTTEFKEKAQQYIENRIGNLEVEQVQELEELDEKMDDALVNIDRAMVNVMNSQLDFKTDDLFFDKFKVSIVGNAHLKSIVTSLHKNNRYNVLVLSAQKRCMPWDYVNLQQESAYDFTQHTHCSNARKFFFNENKIVNQLRFTNDCEGYLNTELVEMLENVQKTFLNIQDELLIQDLQALKNIIAESNTEPQLCQFIRGLIIQANNSQETPFLKRCTLRQTLQTYPENQKLTVIIKKMDETAFAITPEENIHNTAKTQLKS